MKLVEILAKELSEWPEDAHVAVQDPDRDNTIWFQSEGHEHLRFEDDRWLCRSMFDILVSKPSCRASDYKTAIVTESQWQAERDKQKGGEWKRHRGGKCPVSGNTQVEVKFRDGDIRQSHASDFFGWKHGEIDDVRAEIMQYRVISQPQAEEVEVRKFTRDLNMHTPQGEFVREPISLGDEVIYPADPEWHTDQIDGPFKWRDTVNELDAYIEELTREREALINRLASEGLALIPPVVGVVSEFSGVDFSDWRNWKAGDIVEVILDNDSDLPIGERYVVKEIERPDYEFGMPVCVRTGSDPFNYQWAWDSEGEDRLVFKFIRRP